MGESLEVYESSEVLQVQFATGERLCPEVGTIGGGIQPWGRVGHQGCETADAVGEPDRVFVEEFRLKTRSYVLKTRKRNTSVV